MIARLAESYRLYRTARSCDWPRLRSVRWAINLVFSQRSGRQGANHG